MPRWFERLTHWKLTRASEPENPAEVSFEARCTRCGRLFHTTTLADPVLCWWCASLLAHKDHEDEKHADLHPGQ